MRCCPYVLHMVSAGRYRQKREVVDGTRFALQGAGDLYRRRYWKDDVFDVVDRLDGFVQQQGLKLVHAALAWVLAQEGITSAIVGASRPDQLEESLKGVTAVLDENVRAACDEAWFSLPRERDVQIARR